MFTQNGLKLKDTLVIDEELAEAIGHWFELHKALQVADPPEFQNIQRYIDYSSLDLAYRLAELSKA